MHTFKPIRATSKASSNQRKRLICALAFIILVSVWQISIYQIRPNIGDKAQYIEYAQVYGLDDSIIFAYKEPAFSIISKIGFDLDQHFSLGQDSGVGLVNILASLLLSFGLSRLAVGGVGVYFRLIPLFLLYDFIYLSAETIRAHLAFGLFLLYLATRREGRSAVVLATAAVLTHFSFLIPIVVLEIWRLGRQRRLSVVLLAVVVATCGAIALGGDGVISIFEQVAGAGLETERQFTLVRAYIIPLIVLVILLSTVDLGNGDLRAVACTFLAMTPILYSLGATEIALRSFSAAMIFVLLYFCLARPVLFSRADMFIMTLTFSIAYTIVSPLRLLYSG